MENLPVEVKLQILVELPVKHIIQIRRVNRHFREVIDEPANQTTILEPAQTRALYRLLQSVDELLDYDPTEGFWTAFRNFVAHGGIPWHREPRRFETRMFLTQWDYRRTGQKPPYDQHLDMPYVFFTVSLLVGDIVRRHFERNGPLKACYWDWGCPVDFYPIDLHTALDHLEMSTQDLEDVYDLVRDTEGGYFQGDACMRSLPDRVPKWCLTKLYDGVEQLYATDMHVLTARFDSKQLSNLLGVPDITEHTLRFAYYVKTEWAYRRVEKAIHEGKPLSPLEKAAVLEETFLY